MTDKNRYVVPALVVVLMAVAFVLPAASMQLIHLRDGSAIRGTVVEMKDGFYRIDTTTMGTVKVPADQVVSIVAEGAAPQIRETVVPRPPSAGSSSPVTNATHGVRSPSPATSADPYTPAPGSLKQQQDMVNSTVQTMLTGENFLEKIMELGQNPDMLDIMSDDALMDAISSNDYQSLMQNEKMQRLMNNADLRELLGEFQLDGE